MLYNRVETSDPLMTTIVVDVRVRALLKVVSSCIELERAPTVCIDRRVYTYLSYRVVYLAYLQYLNV